MAAESGDGVVERALEDEAAKERRSSRSRSRRSRRSRRRSRSRSSGSRGKDSARTPQSRRFPRPIRDEDRGDELTLFDRTQWSERKTADGKRLDDRLGLGKLPDRPDAPPPGGDKNGEQMVMQQTEAVLCAAEVGGAAPQGDVPGEDMAARAERDEYLQKRPKITLILRLVAALLTVTGLALLIAGGLGAGGELAAVVLSGVALIVGAFLAIGFALFCHVATMTDGGEARWEWHKAWQVGPVMGDAASVLNLLFSGVLAAYYGASPLLNPWWITACPFLLIGAAIHAATGVIIFKGRIL